MHRSVPSLVLVTALATFGCGGSNNSSPTSPSVNVNVPFSSTDLVVGPGTQATAGHKVTVNYTGWFYDASKPDNKGTQFDSSLSPGRTPFQFTIGAGSVIRGWDQGVPGMRVGGQRRLIIPPDLAYGSTGFQSIPPNATLVFDISLLDVQ